MENSLLIENIFENHQCEKKLLVLSKKISYQNTSIRLKIKDLMKHNWITKVSKEGTIEMTDRICIFRILVVHL